MIKKLFAPFTSLSYQKARKRNSLFALLGLVAMGLLFTGGLYKVAMEVPATAETATQEQVDRGKKLFVANCATCHGLNAEGTENAPTLVGAGAAAVDFQVGSGRMPLQMNGPQGLYKPPQFSKEDVAALAAYVASLGPGPAIPEAHYLDGKGNIALGAELFRINCAMCHNVAGAGGALTEGKFAPKLLGISALHMYEAMLTGPQSMPVFNDAYLTPEQKRDIISYLKYKENNDSPGGLSLDSLGPVAEGLFIWVFVMGALVAITIWVAAKTN